MKEYNKEELNDVIERLIDIYNSERTVSGYPRVGDAGTPYSIKQVIDDEEHRTVVIVWEDGTSTKAVADPEDTYDFMVGFGLCIAKRFVKNLAQYATALHRSSRCIHVPKKPEAPAKKVSKK